MWTCRQCGEQIEDQFTSCWKCANNGVEIVQAGWGEHPDVKDITLSTTPFVPGQEITQSLGVVCGEAILGANIVSDILAGITDIVGGRSGAYESKLKDARQIALVEMALEARERGANAVVGIDIDYESLRGSMLMVTASGTAVAAKKV